MEHTILFMDTSDTKMTHTVTVYSTPTCHFCHLAKDFFNENNVAFTDYNVAEDAERRNELLEKTGQMAVPVIDIDGTLVVGFDQGQITSLLGL